MSTVTFFLVLIQSHLLDFRGRAHHLTDKLHEAS